MKNKNNKNSRQDIAIAEMKIEFKNLKKRFDDFIKNDFRHLEERVEKIHDKLFSGFIIGIASVIITQIILNVFK